MAPAVVAQQVSAAIPSGMVPIPEGTFQMGDERISRAKPMHSTKLSQFAIDKYEVSIELWESVRAWGNEHGYDLVAGSSFGAKNPVHSINWYDAVKWNNARSEKEGRSPAYYEDESMMVIYRNGIKVPAGISWDTGYRLPTEAEWEKAARGGITGKMYPWGTDEINPDFANYDLSIKRGTTPIGLYMANGYGLYDMAGNVWEWCWDLYGGYSPTDQTDPRGAIVGGDRVIRGGSWAMAGENGQVAIRYNNIPDSRVNSYGFRSALSLKYEMVALTSQPLSVSGVEGESVQFSVTATGSPIPNYQWF